MKRTIVTSIIFILLAISVQGQQVHDTVFLDEKRNECSRGNYMYYRIKTSTRDGYFQKDYYKSGQLQSENFFLKGKLRIQDGLSRSYFENGTVKHEAYYSLGEHEGVSKTFYPSGSLYYSKQYNINKLHGKMKVYYENGNLKREEIYNKDSLISGVCYKLDGSLDVYTPFEQPPNFVGGDRARIHYLSENIKYPLEARNKRIQGVVYITFVLTEEGEVEEVEVVKGVHPALDAEALRVIKNMPNWTPGKQDGKNVRVQFNMPIKFTLAG